MKWIVYFKFEYEIISLLDIFKKKKKQIEMRVKSDDNYEFFTNYKI